MFLANFQCTMMRSEFAFCLGQLDHCCECEVQTPQNFTLARNSGAYGMKLFPLHWIFVPAALILGYGFLFGFDFIPTHLVTGCCPKLLCCSEINQEIILVQTCETPRWTPLFSYALVVTELPTTHNTKHRKWRQLQKSHDLFKGIQGIQPFMLAIYHSTVWYIYPFYPALLLF